VGSHESREIGDDGREVRKTSVGSEDLEEVGDDGGRTGGNESADELGAVVGEEGRVACLSTILLVAMVYLRASSARALEL
jgi:hypothetical protein